MKTTIIEYIHSYIPSRTSSLAWIVLYQYRLMWISIPRKYRVVIEMLHYIFLNYIIGISNAAYT